ncbi:MAG: arylsulfatase [Haliea sp.]|nr:arylsulfatase [Haliea sp.]
MTLDATAQARPNIVLIVADDIGYSDFGAFGGEIETPNIDALAARGVRFSNFHAASSCAPTRAMLLTGVDNHLAGVGSMRELMPLSHRGKPGYDGVLNDRVQTIASLLQASGYRTSIAGKWHLGEEPHNLPPARGFDFSVIQADSGSDNFEMRAYLPMKPEAYWYDKGERMSALPEDFYSSTFFVARTIEFLQSTQSDGGPFFAYIAFQANHTPIQAPGAFIDHYRGRYTQGWEEIRNARIEKIKEYGLVDEQATLAAGPSQEEWDPLDAGQQYFEARRMQAYAGMATAMDHEIGRLLEYLRDTNQYDNTVFVILSDNGATTTEPYENAFARRWFEKNYRQDVETLGEKGSWVAAGKRWGQVSNTPFSGYKFNAGEGGVRVPLIIAGLPAIDPGAVYREFAYITDLAPTLLEIAGVALPAVEDGRENITGKSLLPTFTGEASPVHRVDEAIGYEFSGNSALYRGDYKLVRNQPPAGDSQWRLYQISSDPGETTDLSARMPELFAALQAQYDAYASAAGVLPLPDDYSLNRQVLVNALVFVYLPKYLPWLGGGLALVIAYVIYRRRRRAGQ